MVPFLISARDLTQETSFGSHALLLLYKVQCAKVRTCVRCSTMMDTTDVSLSYERMECPNYVS